MHHDSILNSSAGRSGRLFAAARGLRNCGSLYCSSALIRHFSTQLLLAAICLSLTACSSKPPEIAASNNPDQIAKLQSQRNQQSTDLWKRAAEAGIDFSWLPENAELVAQIRVKSLLEAPLVAQLPTELSADRWSQFPNLGVQGAVEEFTLVQFGLNTLAGSSEGILQAPAPFTRMKTVEPFDLAKLQADENYEQLPGETPLFRLRGEERADAPPMLALPEPRILLSGSESEIRAALARGVVTLESTAESTAVRRNQILVWVQPRQGRDLAQQLSPLLPQVLKQLGQGIGDHAAGCLIRGRVWSELECAVDFHCGSADQAKALSADLDTFVGQLRRLAEENRIVLEALPGVGGLVSQLLSDLEVVQAGDLAGYRLTLSETSLAQFMASRSSMLARPTTLSGERANSSFSFGPSLEELRESAVPVPATGLPQGARMIAVTRWAPDFLGELNAQLPRGWDMVLLVVDGLAPDVVAVDRVEVRDARLSDGTLLKRRASEFLDASRPRRRQLVNREQFDEHPEDGVAISLSFHPPARRGDDRSPAVAHINGAFTLIRAGRIVEREIPDLRQWLEQVPTEDEFADLRAAGLRVQLVENGAGESSPQFLLRLQQGSLLQSVNVGESGSPLSQQAFVQNEIEADGRSVARVGFLEGLPPGPIPVQLRWATDLVEERVAFDLPELPLPEFGDSLTPDQRALLVWKASTLPVPTLPDVRIEARARWSWSRFFDEHGKPWDREFSVAIDLTGEPAERIVAFGKLQLTSAVSDAGDITDHWDPRFVLDNLQEKLVPVDREFALDDYPPDGMQVEYLFDSWPESARSLTRLAGQFTVVTAARQTVVISPEINLEARQLYTHEELDQAGIALSLIPFEDQLTVALSSGNPEALDSLALLDELGDPLSGVFGTRSSFGGGIEYSFQALGPLPKQLRLRIVLNDGLEYHDIPFEFLDLPIPPRPSESPKSE